MSTLLRRRELVNGVNLPVKSFSACSWEEIKLICDAGKAQSYVDKGIWTIGETHANGPGGTNLLRLVHILTEEQRSASYYNTAGHIVLLFTRAGEEFKWSTSANNAINYYNSIFFSTIQPTGGLTWFSDEVKAIAQTFTVKTSNNATGMGVVSAGYYSRSAKTQLPNAVEVGLSNYYRPDENAVSFCFDYFNTTTSVAQSRRKIETYGSYTTWWWLRSPAYSSNLGTAWNSYSINSSGELTPDSYTDAIAPGRMIVV